MAKFDEELWSVLLVVLYLYETNLVTNEYEWSKICVEVARWQKLN